jgi:hypothetical protein
MTFFEMGNGHFCQAVKREMSLEDIIVLQVLTTNGLLIRPLVTTTAALLAVSLSVQPSQRNAQADPFAPLLRYGRYFTIKELVLWIGRNDCKADVERG